MSERKHLDQMKEFIGLIEGVDPEPSIPVDESPFVPQFAMETFRMGQTLTEMGTDRLAVMLGDRSSAEIVLDACETLRSKMAEQDYQEVYFIGEGLAAVFKNIDLEGESETLTESINRNLYRYDSVVDELNEEEDTLHEDLLNLCETWEMYSESDEQEGTFAEGVEYGYALAAQKLRELLESKKIEDKESLDEEHN